MSWLVVSVYAALLIFITLVPWSVGDRVSRIDVLMHFAAWGVLSFLAAIAVRGKKLFPFRVAVSASVGAIVFGVLIEFLQSITGRTPDVLDLIADAIGAIVGAVLGSTYRWLKRRPVAQANDSEDS